MLDYEKEYKRWLENADDITKSQMLNFSKEEIQDSFYKNLEFGTGGLRGTLGPGTNRMNSYVVARATQGLCDYIKEQTLDIKSESIVIAYDSRNYSQVFAKKAAQIISNNNIKAYLFDELRPTPELSFAVRYKKATAGIVITASHNPAEYNGYKVYWSDGGQIPPNIAEKILQKINNVDFFDVATETCDDLVEIIGEEVDEAYIENVFVQSVNPNVKKDDFSLVYTPLHGSGNKLVRRILSRCGFKNILIVKSQELPDGNFPTVSSPNPENKECFDIAVSLAKENGVNLVIGTDPDSDRMGIMVKNDKNEYVPFSGNQVGILLLNYILSNSSLPQNPAAVTTIVSTKMADAICRKHDVKLFRTLTGFKFIGEKIHEFETNNKYNFIFGFEESYGYLKGTYCRDKDAVVASMLICEMAAHYSQKGLTLFDVMQNLYNEYGTYYEELESITFKGVDGASRIKSIMKSFRENRPSRIADYKIENVTDYLCDTDLPKSDVLYFSLEDGIDFVIRPSGTEPKVKIYYLSSGKSHEIAVKKVSVVKQEIAKLLK